LYIRRHRAPHGLPIDDRLDGGQRLVLGDTGEHAIEQAAHLGGIVYAKGLRSQAPIRLNGLDREQESGKMRQVARRSRQMEDQVSVYLLSRTHCISSSLCARI
jgi:hypothetical protein